MLQPTLRTACKAASERQSVNGGRCCQHGSWYLVGLPRHVQVSCKKGVLQGDALCQLQDAFQAYTSAQAVSADLPLQLLSRAHHSVPWQGGPHISSPAGSPASCPAIQALPRKMLSSS